MFYNHFLFDIIPELLGCTADNVTELWGEQEEGDAGGEAPRQAGPQKHRQERGEKFNPKTFLQFV